MSRELGIWELLTSAGNRAMSLDEIIIVCVGGQDKESKRGALECIVKMDDSTCLWLEWAFSKNCSMPMIPIPRKLMQGVDFSA